MPWWGWIIFGAVMFGSELMVVDAAFYLVFIGAAAIITGLVLLAGFGIEPWMQWMLFGVLAIVTMVIFRKKLYEKIRGNQSHYPSGPAGESLQVSEALSPGQSCRMDYRGTTWTVRNDGSTTIAKGQTVAIRKVDGLTLLVDAT